MTIQTQMQAARAGVVTPQMEDVLSDEPITRDELLPMLPQDASPYPQTSAIPTSRASASEPVFEPRSM